MGALTRSREDVVAAMSPGQLGVLAAAHAAVGHYSPALEAKAAELLTLREQLEGGEAMGAGFALDGGPSAS